MRLGKGFAGKPGIADAVGSHKGALPNLYKGAAPPRQLLPKGLSAPFAGIGSPFCKFGQPCEVAFAGAFAKGSAHAGFSN